MATIDDDKKEEFTIGGRILKETVRY